MVVECVPFGKESDSSAGVAVGAMRNCGGKLCDKGSCYFVFFCEGSIVESNRLVRWSGSVFAGYGFDGVPEMRNVVFVRARLDCVYPFFSVGFGNVLCYL